MNRCDPVRNEFLENQDSPGQTEAIPFQSGISEPDFPIQRDHPRRANYQGLQHRPRCRIRVPTCLMGVIKDASIVLRGDTAASAST